MFFTIDERRFLLARTEPLGCMQIVEATIDEDTGALPGNAMISMAVDRHGVDSRGCKQRMHPDSLQISIHRASQASSDARACERSVWLTVGAR